MGAHYQRQLQVVIADCTVGHYPVAGVGCNVVCDGPSAAGSSSAGSDGGVQQRWCGASRGLPMMIGGVTSQCFHRKAV